MTRQPQARRHFIAEVMTPKGVKTITFKADSEYHARWLVSKLSTTTKLLNLRPQS